MNYHTHRIAGICLGTAAGLFLEQKAPVVGLLAIAGGVGGLLPDIDEPNSYFGKHFTFIAKPMKKFLGHRSLTHSILGVILLFAIFVLLSYIKNENAPYILIGIYILFIIICFPTLSFILIGGLYAISQTGMAWEDAYIFTAFGFVLGQISHLFMDLITINGIPVFYPFSKKRYSLLPLHTNSGDWVGIIISFITLASGVAYYLITNNIIALN